MTYNNKRWFREKEGPKNKVPTTELLDQNAEESSERGRNREKEMIHSLVCRHSLCQRPLVLKKCVISAPQVLVSAPQVLVQVKK